MKRITLSCVVLALLGATEASALAAGRKMTREELHAANWVYNALSSNKEGGKTPIGSPFNGTRPRNLTNLIVYATKVPIAYESFGRRLFKVVFRGKDAASGRNRKYTVPVFQNNGKIGANG